MVNVFLWPNFYCCARERQILLWEWVHGMYEPTQPLKNLKLSRQYASKLTKVLVFGLILFYSLQLSLLLSYTVTIYKRKRKIFMRWAGKISLFFYNLRIMRNKNLTNLNLCWLLNLFCRFLNLYAFSIVCPQFIVGLSSACNQTSRYNLIG
jgi:hypothetical protein